MSAVRQPGRVVPEDDAPAAADSVRTPLAGEAAGWDQPSWDSAVALRDLYSWHFHGRRRERMFLASVAFIVAFASVRGITYSIRAGIGPFQNMDVGGTHVHHLVWGIAALLIVGYLWLAEVGTGADGTAVWTSRLTAVLYGAGAALTLDEFAVWLNLRDVYWEEQGRMSIDAVLLFGASLSAGFLGAPFLHAAGRLMLGARHLRDHRSKACRNALNLRGAPKRTYD